MSDWTSGQQLKDGKYIVEALLGMGGFGITYRAREQPSGKLVAIKTLNSRVQRKANFAELQEKFLNEALCLARCNHPHVVEVYPKLFQQDGLWCMVMEYIEGEDLASYLENRGVLSEAEALGIIRQVGEALVCVHNQGFLHRDVKPQNIIMRRHNSSAVLIDFGLAREFTIGQVLTHTNDRTQHFAPIEQYERRAERGAYTDVYALAATLYVLLTGELPIIANFRKYEPLVAPKQHNPQISDRVNAAILKGMELEPKDRSQSLREWLELLEESKLKGFRFEVVTVNATGEIIHRQQKQAEYFVETFNGTSLEMVGIPGGTFMMGSLSTEEGRSDRESPQHRVTVAPFFLGKYPITQEQYEAVMGYNPSDFKGKKRPVECVSWDRANEFCQQLSQITGKIYRLPSEAEWEYACCAATTTPFHFGETITTDLANYRGTDWQLGDTTYPGFYGKGSRGIYRQQTTDVGSFPPNAFGLYDMHGNVWEWCADRWHKNYQGAPTDGSIWGKNGNDNSFFCLRGGSWRDVPFLCRSAYRFIDSRDCYYYAFGFRVCCAVGRT